MCSVYRPETQESGAFFSEQLEHNIALECQDMNKGYGRRPSLENKVSTAYKNCKNND